MTARESFKRAAALVFVFVWIVDDEIRQAIRRRMTRRPGCR